MLSLKDLGKGCSPPMAMHIPNSPFRSLRQEGKKKQKYVTFPARPATQIIYIRQTVQMAKCRVQGIKKNSDRLGKAFKTDRTT